MAYEGRAECITSVWAAHAGSPVLILTDPTTVTVIDTTTGQALSEHDIDPTRAYWRT